MGQYWKSIDRLDPVTAMRHPAPSSLKHGVAPGSSVSKTVATPSARSRAFAHGTVLAKAQGLSRIRGLPRRFSADSQSRELVRRRASNFFLDLNLFLAR